MTTTSASSSSSWRSLRSAPCQSACRSDGANLSISRSQFVTTLVGATMSALKGLRLPSIFASSFFTARRSASVCTVLPSPMSSARTPPEPISWRNQSQWKPCSWYGRSCALRLRGFRAPLISSMSRSFLKSSFASSVTLERPTCVEQLLDAPRLRERQLAAVAAAGGEDLRLALEHLAHLLRDRAGRTCRRRGARTCGPR